MSSHIMSLKLGFVVSTVILLFVLCTGAPIQELDIKQTEFCWKNSYGRGVGQPLSYCPNAERNGALCYPNCRNGYKGVGPVCWQYCPSGYHDDGAFCRKNAHIYGKGCCCTLFTKGCCNKCPAGYKDDGCTCRKDAHIFAKSTYGRSAGFPMSCAPGLENNAALCYKSCSLGFKGVGPVCWGTCPQGWSDCGAGCAVSTLGCVGKIMEMVQSVGSMVMNVATLGTSSAVSAATRVKKMAFKMAKKGIQKGIMSAGKKQNPADIALDVAEAIDPIGAVAAARSFIFPLCNKVKTAN